MINMSFKKDISIFFNYLKTSKENKVLFPYKLKYHKLKRVLSILINYGVITNFGILNNRVYILRNKYTLYDIFWPPRTTYLSSYKIRGVVSKHSGNVLVVSTSMGIFDGKDVCKLNIGGYVLFNIKLKNSLI